MQRPLLFDAVLFDLDGTLVATDRFWVQAARTGARRAFEELGIERELPTRDEWLSVIGHSLASGFERLFGDLGEERWRHVMRRCEEEEHALLDAGGAALMPGASGAIDALASSGAHLGIASNCSQDYLDHMTGGLGLGGRFARGYCLDTQGIRDKAGMLERLLGDFATRSAIMVGDRAGDRDSAWSNGLPHVHCAFGFAGGDEPVAAEARIEDLGELPSVLERRALWIEAAIARLRLPAPAEGTRPPVIGVTGGLASGKSLFARDLARMLRSAGRLATAVTLDAYRPEGGALFWEREWGGGIGTEVDLERLERDLFEPFSAGDEVALAPAARLEPGDEHLAPEAVLVIEGPFLLDPRVRSHLDRVVALEITDETLWRRLSGREGRVFGPEALAGIRANVLPALAAHADRYPPHRLADLVLAADNPLGDDG